MRNALSQVPLPDRRRTFSCYHTHRKQRGNFLELARQILSLEGQENRLLGLLHHSWKITAASKAWER